MTDPHPQHPPHPHVPPVHHPQDRSYIFNRFDEKFNDHEGRIRELERKTWDSQQIVSAIRWVVLIIGSSVITLFGSFAFDVYIAGG